VLLALAALIITSVANAQTGKVEVVGGDTYNWGSVPPGKLKADLIVRNVGAGVLKIDTVRPACGCTTSPIDRKTLQPGESATVHVTLDASYRSGHLEKSVTIVSNDSTTPYHFVRLVAEIKRAVSVVPSSNFVLTDGQVGVEAASAPVVIKNTGDIPLTVSPPKLVEGGNVDVRFEMTEARVLAPGESMEIRALMTPRNDRTVFGSVTITTTAPEAPLLTFGLTGTLAQADTQVGTVTPH